TLEFTAPEAGDMAVLRELREDFEIGLGCVGTEPGQVDSTGQIVGRVEAALKHLAAGRITLNPDCGFAPGSAAVVSLDEVYQKVKNEVAAAGVLRERYACPLIPSPASRSPSAPCLSPGRTATAGCDRSRPGACRRASGRWRRSSPGPPPSATRPCRSRRRG